jgi:hypothetical protein
MFADKEKLPVEKKDIKIAKSPVIENKIEIAEAKIYKIFMQVYLQKLLS